MEKALFDAEACRMALTSLPAVRALPLAKNVLAHPRLIALVNDIPEILGNWALDDEAFDADRFWHMRHTWFSSERVRVDITTAATAVAGLSAQASAVSAFFKAAHMRETITAQVQLARVGAKLLDAAASVSDLPVRPEFSLLHEGQIASAMESLNAELARLLVANGLPPALAKSMNDGQLTIAELLNTAPHVLLLSLPNQIEPTAQAKPGPKKAKKRSKR